MNSNSRLKSSKSRLNGRDQRRSGAAWQRHVRIARQRPSIMRAGIESHRPVNATVVELHGRSRASIVARLLLALLKP